MQQQGVHDPEELAFQAAIASPLDPREKLLPRGVDMDSDARRAMKSHEFIETYGTRLEAETARRLIRAGLSDLLVPRPPRSEAAIHDGLFRYDACEAAYFLHGLVESPLLDVALAGSVAKLQQRRRSAKGPK